MRVKKSYAEPNTDTLNPETITQAHSPSLLYLLEEGPMQVMFHYKLDQRNRERRYSPVGGSAQEPEIE